MEKIIERLEKLREEGQMIITPDFSISYNPFKDVFVVEVPDGSKFIELTHTGSMQSYIFDVSGMYPYEISASGSYKEAWKQMEQYISGATLDMIPSFTQAGQEYIWVDGDDGVKAVLKETITMING